MRTIFHILLIFSICVTVVNAQNKSSEKSDATKSAPSKAGTTSKVFLKADKQIYSPGDVILFHARVFNCLTETPSSDEDLLVMIKGNKGEIIVDQKFKVEAGIVNGTLSIPEWVNEGPAFLVAFTPRALLNSQANLTGIVPLVINSLRKNDYILSIHPDKKIFRPGDDIELNVFLTSITPGNRKEKVNFILSDLKEALIQEAITLKVGMNKLKYKIPPHFQQGLYIEISGQGKDFIYQKVPIRTTQDDIQLEFYPEGGHLLTNTIQRIVYRVTDPFGNPITVTGKVYDKGNHFVGIGKILKPGYGLISLMPMPGMQYTFVIDSHYGNGVHLDLPETLIDGAALAYWKTEPEMIRTSLRTSGKYVNQELSLLVSSASETFYQEKFIAKDEMRLDLFREKLPSGILSFKILDDNGELLSERLIYNANALEEGLALEPKITFSKNSKEGVMKIDASTFQKCYPKAVYDVRIVDKLSLFDEYEEMPHSFLRFPLTETFPITVLDVYMVNIELIANQNISVCNENNETTIQSSSNRGKTIRGKVTDKKGRPVHNAVIMAIHPDYPNIWTTRSDKNGNFTIDGVSKTCELKMKAFNKTEKKTYQVKLVHTFDESLDRLLRNYSFAISKIYSLNTAFVYYENNKELLHTFQNESKDHRPKSNDNVQQMLQSGSDILDVIKMMKPLHIEGNQIVFYGSENSFNYQSGALIIIDGQKMGTDIGVLNSLSSMEVKSINVSTNPIDIQVYTGLNSVGIIVIKTRGASDDKDLNIGDERKQNATLQNSKATPTTRLWMPGVTSPDGKFELKFDLGELKTDFEIIVDAVSEYGQEIRSKTSVTNR